MRKTLGEKNRNPGNVKATLGRAWRGQKDVDGLGFVKFLSPQDGYRALLRTVWAKLRDGKSCVEELGASWLSGMPEATIEDWVQGVAQHSGIYRRMHLGGATVGDQAAGIEKDDRLTGWGVAIVSMLAYGIMIQECGRPWVSMRDRAEALMTVVAEGWERGARG